ncbi:MAG: hypothetical protein ABIK62_07860, partial [candidate division WOR-3 bacterium]
CEALGMTGDAALREPTQRAIQYIAATQHPQQGGWRYEPRVDSDTSVSGWKLMALKRAQMAGLEVPGQTLQRVSAWLDATQTDGGARYMYNPNAADTPDQRPGRSPNPAMTAEGLLMRMYLGWDRKNPALLKGAEYLLENLPELVFASLQLVALHYRFGNLLLHCGLLARQCQLQFLKLCLVLAQHFLVSLVLVLALGFRCLQLSPQGAQFVLACSEALG